MPIGSVGRSLAWNTLDVLPLFLRRQLLFLMHHNRFGNFANPRTFNEKVNWRIIYDRRDMLVWTCDKTLIKETAVRHGIRVPQTYWSGPDIEEFPFGDLPPSWVLKPNNRTGMVLFGQGEPAERDVIRSVTDVWSNDQGVTRKGEWAYTLAQPGFLLEERIGPITSTPNDYKVYVFDGQPQLILVDVDRFSLHRSRFYSVDWEPMPIRDRVPPSRPIERPRRLVDILDQASIMASGVRFPPGGLLH